MNKVERLKRIAKIISDAIARQSNFADVHVNDKLTVLWFKEGQVAKLLELAIVTDEEAERMDDEEIERLPLRCTNCGNEFPLNGIFGEGHPCPNCGNPLSLDTGKPEQALTILTCPICSHEFKALIVPNECPSCNNRVTF